MGLCGSQLLLAQLAWDEVSAAVAVDPNHQGKVEKELAKAPGRTGQG